jgi:cellulose biosynthesis protein BcsQ
VALIASYALWNNKGGVGKSTITFHLATRYAQRHPERNVLVIDMCPQANVSMILLGGGPLGEDRVLQQCQFDPTPKSIVGYLASVLSGGAGAQLPDPMSYIVVPNLHNFNIPENLYLLCGDGNLEPMAPLISERANQAALPPAEHPWKWVHTIVRRYIENISQIDGDWTVFVDTNPSFSIYTEIAISGVNKLIVPVNADDASRVAVSAMFSLIYGANPPHPFYGQYTYAAKADSHGIQRPIVQLVVGNRLTQNLGPAAAFGALSNATADALFEAFQQSSNRFEAIDPPPATVEDFRSSFSVSLRDFNTAGVVAAHLGTPLSGLTERNYNVYGTSVSVDARRTKECREAIDEVVARL